jgi:hypothetical protein
LVIGFAIHTLTPLKFPFYENLLGAPGETKAVNTTSNKSDTSSIKITDISGFVKDSITQDPLQGAQIFF